MLDGLIMGFIPRCWFLEFGVRTFWNWSWWRCDCKVFKRCSLLCVLPRIKCLMEKIPECSTGCWWVHSRYVGWGQQVLAECGSEMPLPIVKGSTKHLRCDVPTCLHLPLLLLFTLFQGSVHCSTNSLFSFNNFLGCRVYEASRVFDGWIIESSHYLVEPELLLTSRSSSRWQTDESRGVYNLLGYTFSMNISHVWCMVY